MRRADQVFASSMIIAFMYWIVLLVYPSAVSPLANFFQWVADFAVVLGYPGTFLVCLLGSASVVVEIPFAGVPFVLGGLRDGIVGPFIFDPWVVGILSGIGATIGDMTSYALGYAGRRLVDDANTKGFSRFIETYPRATPAAIFLLASTPLPLDPAVVALGVARYSWWKLFWPCLIGEIIFLSAVSWAGRLSLDWFIELLGVGGPVTPISATVEVLGIVLLIVTVYLAVRLDWAQVGKKIRKADIQATE
ncbi:MAG: VTT domain-containing protein [Candidatus Thorarchaeota archaeon]|nr:VTT domain-containing protein [Candidatus Thorarchaeota archaeon]